MWLLAACATPPRVEDARVPPGALPAIDLLTLEGNHQSLATTLAGRPALVSLWATWCEACSKEFDSLNRLDASARSRGAVVVGIAIGEPRATVAEFVTRNGLGYTQLVDEEFHFADALGQKKVPATLVVNREGRVTFVGGVFDQAAIHALDAALVIGHERAAHNR